MKRLSFIATAIVILACGVNGAPGRAGQSSSLADAQHDFNSGRYNRAVDALNSAIAKSPNDGSLHFLLGQSYYELGNSSAPWPALNAPSNLIRRIPNIATGSLNL